MYNMPDEPKYRHLQERINSLDEIVNYISGHESIDEFSGYRVEFRLKAARFQSAFSILLEAKFPVELYKFPRWLSDRYPCAKSL